MIVPVHNLKYMILCAFLQLPTALTVNAEEEQAVTGQELLDTCNGQTTGNSPNQMCMQYVFGLVQTVTMLQQMDPGQQVFCIDPSRVSLQEATLNVQGWLADQPARLQEDAYKLVSEALNHHYPCSL